VSGTAYLAGSYFYCRHKRAQDRFKYQRINLALNEYIAKRGTERDDDEED